MRPILPFLLAPALLLSPGLAAPLRAAVPAKAPAKAAPAHKLAPGDITRAQMQAQVKKTFAIADTNHDGYMSRKEFAVRMGAVLTHSGVQDKAQAQQMLDAANRAFDDVDTNHDGKLSLAEASKRPLAAFDMMDTNHDGVLTVAEKAAAHRDAPPVPTGPTQGEMQGPGR